MASSSFLVIRIHPDSPVDGGTFGTYLDGLQIQVYPADEPQTAAHLLGETPVALAPLTLTPVPLALGTYVAAVTKLVTTQTAEVATNDFGKKLVFANADGIAVGAVITTIVGSGATNPFQGDTVVTDITPATNPPTSQTVTLSKSIQASVAAGTVVTFFSKYTGIAPTWGSANPSFSIQQKTSAKATNTNTVSFTSIDGVSVGMQVSAASGVPAGTEVLGATGTSLTLSNNVTLAKNAAVTFTWNLNTGIVQHYEQISFPIFGLSLAPMPQAVATAVIVLNPAPAANTYLDIAIVAIRNGQTIPVNTEFYNVIVTVDNLPTPDQYQGISLTQTSLYLTLPAPPLNTNAISLIIPSDGTAPRFDDLFPAMQKALSNDPFFAGADILNLTADQCTRMAYDIVWSQQNVLPSPPDPLETLYTNPPNTGGSGGSSGNDEQDRQKFEGAINSFYSTRNSSAERLAKFVAAASAALNCENLSLHAPEALLEFPVDPGSLPNPSPVRSEVLLTGLSATGMNFAVPAGFFYALGNKQDKNTSAAARYQIATGDTPERVLLEVGQAVSTKVIAAKNDDSEHFALPLTSAINTHPTITAVQAVRRLAALRVDTSVSTSPQVALPATGPLVDLVNAWLAASTQQKPSYKFYTPGVDDDTIWGMLVVNPNPTNLVDESNLQATVQPTEAGFLQLDLGALTRGFEISPGVTLASKIAAFLPGPNPTVATLKNVTAAQWTAFFIPPSPPPPLPPVPPNATWLPPFVQPAAVNTPSGNTPKGDGYISACVKSFIRAVQKFFTVSSLPNMPATLTPGAPSTFDLPPFDAITMAVANLPAGFTFGAGTLTPAQISAAVSGVFSPGANRRAEAWLAGAVVTINELSLIAKVVPQVAPNALPVPGDLHFSVVEALYARGFSSAKEITALSQPEFQQALTGTVAYPYAIAPTPGGTPSLYDTAATIAPPTTTTTDGNGTFIPINPDGSLTNCIPSPCASPLGPIAYLNEILQLSEESKCENPLPPLTKTLGSVVSQRRGPIGDNLDASCPNLETPLPTIDIVNECLEFMGSVASPTNGAVYNTSLDGIAGNVFQHDESCEDEEKRASRHDAAKLLAALPEYSTPATPVSANSSVEPLVYNNLKSDFSSCCLPYSQALDNSRTYLRHFRTCRFEEMRTFRKCITEFVLDPVGEPAGFQSHLWRYPVRIDTAIEYLGITPEEYASLFQGAAAQPCASSRDSTSPNNPAGTPAQPTDTKTLGAPTAQPSRVQTQAVAGVPVWELYGFDSAGDNDPWTSTVVQLPEFLERTCLTYCEFYELWQSGFVSFGNGDDQKNGAFPQCEPCCLDKLWLQFGQGGDSTQSLEQGLLMLAVFIRLWRKLKESCCFCYSFAQLRDICDVLVLFNKDSINPDFIRQLAAFQMLLDHFRMELTDAHDKTPATAIDADRTHLLALWVGPTAKKWHWAVDQLLDRVQHYARRHHKCNQRSPEFIKILTSNLDPLSQLAGFDPTSDIDNWHAVPTHTVRFAEILAKIYASDFSIGEILYLFTAGSHLDGDDPFPLQEENEALDAPLGLPDDQEKFSLWILRHKLMDTRIDGEEVEKWHWKRIEAALQDEFGFALSEIQALGRHFFPDVLERAGYHVDETSRRFFSSLPAASTTTQTWNVPPDGPFHYDSAAQQLSTQIPLTDEAVLAKLTYVHSLDDDEQKAVQDLYFQPRAMLAKFALLFADFAHGAEHMIEEHEEKERWEYFRKQFVLCRCRSRIVAEHLSHHVAAVTGQKCPEGDEAALLILRELFGDENKATTDWENNDGTPPLVTWTPPPNGGAFAALLGLTGTGLMAEYRPAGGAVVWRSPCGSVAGFGRARDRENCPVPGVLPSMNATLTPQQMQFVSVHNGFLMKDATGDWLGGAQGFEVRWEGCLLVDHEGTYEFWAGAPAEGDEKPDCETAEHNVWRIVLKRGQRTWVLISHHWPGDAELRSSSLPLKRGAYELTVEFSQPAPEFHSDEEVRPRHAGFQIKYAGPDSQGRRTEIPHTQLFSIFKDGTLRGSITPISPGANAFLDQLYTSSLRDIRRTYQRAFKSLLFAHRFALSARRKSHGTSELGYMLGQKEKFAGAGYYRDGSSFKRHAADFDFNFLPIGDNFHPPSQDTRTHPLPQRIQAMFDWWERLFDYVVARREVFHRCERHLWHLFEEAEEKQPAHSAYLLRHMGADSRDWHLDVRYFQGQAAAVYQVTSDDLEDERWTLRAWHADRWLRSLKCNFSCKDITVARPDLWASDDPSALVDGEKETGNANLSSFLCDGCLENGEPRRYLDIKRLNDCLRQRGRNALLAYLCRMNRVALPWMPGQFAQVPRDLSDLLLLDVESGLGEKTSRIDEAITAVQNFVRRARLGLEPAWAVHSAFARLWDRRFATYRIWEACKRRELYKENWIDWDELESARRVEAFRFLESGLQRATLTIAKPGGGEWWPDERPPKHDNLCALQVGEPSTIQPLPTTPPTPEGWTILGTPERDAQPSWLAAPSLSGSGGSTGTSPVGAQSPATPLALARKTAQDVLPANLPFWLEAAIRLGTQFIRIAAAGEPAGSSEWGADSGRRGGCCAECGCMHAPLVDEYYFWLIPAERYVRPDQADGMPTTTTGSYQFGIQDSFYDQSQQQSAQWNDPANLPPLLHWPSNPAVRMAWCRVHNGEFGQPRRSIASVSLQTGAGASAGSLQFLGRGNDSLYFAVQGAPTPNGDTDKSPPGFRYDLPGDSAVALPLAVPAAKPSSTYPGGLPAYPFFAFDSPGASLFPGSLFAPAVTVANLLRTHCRFELALKWYELAFAPLQSDCTWIDCGSGDQTKPTQPPAGQNPNNPANPNNSPNPNNPQEVPGAPPAVKVLVHAAPSDRLPGGGSNGSGCCDSTKVSRSQVKDRSILLHYLETMVEWGDALMRRGNSPETFQQARLIFDAASLIMGKEPCNVPCGEPAITQKVSAFKPAFPSLNPRLLDLYAVVRDRLDSIRASMNSRRLRNGQVDCEMPYFGNDPVLDGWRTSTEFCAEEGEWCLPRSPYRFTFRIQKALQLAAAVRELGSALLSAYEKGDAEYLASLRAEHESELMELGIAVRQEQWRDADWQIQVLQQTKNLNQANLVYYTNLFQNGFINDEIQYQVLATTAMQTRTGANTVEAVGEAMKVIPDLFVGFPCTDTQVPIGTKLAGVFETIAKVMMVFADIQSSTSQLDLTLAGWDRRSDDWQHQTQTLPIEIEQIELQILGAQRRRGQALLELNNQQRQVEQSTEVLNFLRDKFTSDKLYLFVQRETSELYRKTYELALYAARQAERAFNFERGYTSRRFLPEEIWNTLHEGLLAGERLEYALHHMEKAYCDENVREYELTKHFSLRRHFPMEFLRLRTTGHCEIEIPEWMFDLDFPGHYMRRIKNVTLTIPCVTGPYTGVHCRLTLISSTTRVHPRLSAPLHECCCPPEPCGCDCREEERLAREYRPCPDDPRIVRHYGAREAIATSTGQNDSGLFELNFNDERYLPFEFLGAVSRWRIELPRENNYFDFDSLSDCIIRLNYTAREGGELLRRAANEAAQRHLPGDGWCFFDVRHEFPDAWQLLRDSGDGNGRRKRLSLRLDRKMFPFVPGTREVSISAMAILFRREGEECCPEIEGCPCPEPNKRAGCVVEFRRDTENRGDDGDCDLDVQCFASDQWPDLYYGIFKADIGPLESHDHRRVEFEFPQCEVERAFLLCRYTVRTCRPKPASAARAG